MSADLGGWLQQIGFGQYAEAFKREQIDIEAARHLTDANLKDLGLPMGHRVKFLAAMAAKSRMRESCTSGSVRGAPGDRRLYSTINGQSGSSDQRPYARRNGVLSSEGLRSGYSAHHGGQPSRCSMAERLQVFCLPR